jgi:hypothetical protein
MTAHDAAIRYAITGTYRDAASLVSLLANDPQPTPYAEIWADRARRDFPALNR